MQRHEPSIGGDLKRASGTLRQRFSSSRPSSSRVAADPRDSCRKSSGLPEGPEPAFAAHVWRSRAHARPGLTGPQSLYLQQERLPRCMMRLLATWI